ncbi:MAG: hypothetical protein JXR94_10610 [Candidatus Hydrogenedentes bacterium]|nr:hypothetical protein [Candidatus Hydrogenedentota bacterium]
MLHAILFSAFVLAAVSLAAGVAATAVAELPRPEDPEWQPLADAVYLQEVGRQIETEQPLVAVAVFDGTAYVAGPTGVLRVDGDTLIDAGGPRSAIGRLRTLDGALWAAGPGGLWRYADGAWTEVDAGAYVDVGLHLGGIVAASQEFVFRLDGDALEPINEQPASPPILGIASYSETLYVRQARRLAFLEDGRFDIHNVQDWGHLPHGSITRDLLALGSRLLVPTDQGLAVLRGMSWTTLTGAEGVCYEDTTCVAEGFADDYWVGTMRGAIRAVDGEFHYFGCERWLPGDKVNAIACGDRVAYIATDAGLGIIAYEPYTLQKKAAWYERWLDEWGMRRLGFISTLDRTEDGGYIRFLSDNDVGWACHYLDALCFEYAVTGDAAVRAEAVDVFKSIKWSEEITPIDGFPARAIYAVGEEAQLASTGSGGFPSEWNPTEDGLWKWKGDTSSDEIAAQYYTMSIFYDLVAGDDEKPLVADHIRRMTDHIIDNGWVLRDLDGQPTVWARWDPDFINSPEHTDEHGLNSLEALSILATAQHIVGDTDKYRAAKQQLLDWGYHENVLRAKIVFPHYTHFDDRLAFLAYYPLLNYETDPGLRARYMRSLQRGWECKRFENQAWFSFIYGALTGNACQNAGAVQHLRDYPLDCTNYRFTNSHRDDLAVPDGYTNYVGDTRALGPREQGVRRWDRDPLQLDEGGGRGILDPSSYLDAYWMGRYYGFIAAPPTDDAELLTVPERGLHLGAAPYDGPPRPKLRLEK